MNGVRRTFCVAGLAYLSGAEMGMAQDQGIKQLEKVVARAETVVLSIETAQTQLVRTMDVYNALMAQDSKDRKGLYKKLQQELASTEKRASEIRLRADEMRGEAEILFQSWTGSLGTIESAELRKRSEERQGKSRTAISDIASVSQKVSDLCQPVTKVLHDQIAYLAHDLNIAATASLEPDAAVLNKQVGELSVQMDESIASVQGKIGLLKP